MFFLMNLWMIRKNLIKHYCLKKNNFIVTLIGKLLQIQITIMEKESVMILKQKKLGKSHNLYLKTDTL